MIDDRDAFYAAWGHEKSRKTRKFHGHVLKPWRVEGNPKAKFDHLIPFMERRIWLIRLSMCFSSAKKPKQNLKIQKMSQGWIPLQYLWLHWRPLCWPHVLVPSSSHVLQLQNETYDFRIFVSNLNSASLSILIRICFYLCKFGGQWPGTGISLSIQDMQSIQKHLNDLRIATGTALKQTHIVIDLRAICFRSACEQSLNTCFLWVFRDLRRLFVKWILERCHRRLDVLGCASFALKHIGYICQVFSMWQKCLTMPGSYGSYGCIRL